jgi:hypothetical protein
MRNLKNLLKLKDKEAAYADVPASTKELEAPLPDFADDPSTVVDPQETENVVQMYLRKKRESDAEQEAEQRGMAERTFNALGFPEEGARELAETQPLVDPMISGTISKFVRPVIQTEGTLEAARKAAETFPAKFGRIYNAIKPKATFVPEKIIPAGGKVIRAKK